MSSSSVSHHTFLDAYDAYKERWKELTVVREYNTSQGSIRLRVDSKSVYIEEISIYDTKNQETILCQFLHNLIDNRDIVSIIFVKLSNEEQIAILERFINNKRIFKDIDGDFTWNIHSYYSYYSHYSS